jgi:pimeloyl-ACP methyl ester carboxylesterase
VTKQILYKNTKIAYSDSGKGTAIVLLHGFLENQTMWRHFIPEFSKKNRVIAIDLLGHGNTECLGYVHSMEENAVMVREILRNLRIRKAILVGHSMGGYVALAFAECYPEIIKGLVLLNSTSRADSDERKLNRDRAIKMVKKDYTSFVRLSIANLFSEENRDILLDEIEEVKVEALKTPLQGIIASLEGMKIRKDREVLLHFSNYSKLLLLGKKDGVLNYNENCSQTINTDVELLTFSDGHMSHIENKTELMIVLLAFFNRVNKG